jgi:hypothetical protein
MDILMAHEKGNSLGSTKKKQSHNRRGKSFWIKAVNDCEVSPLSVQDFCAERGLAVSTFHGWRRRLSAAKALPRKSPRAVSKPQSHFLPVYVTSPETPLEKNKQPKRLLDPQPLRNKVRENSLDYLSESSSGLNLHFNEGLKISIDKEFHEPTLQRLVQLFSSKESAPC